METELSIAKNRDRFIKLIIADDHLIFMEGLKRLLQDKQNIEVINVAHNGKELLQTLLSEHPDVILMDINMPKMNGLQATEVIKKSYPNIKIIVLSTYNEKHLVEKAKQNLADGYLLKNCNSDELVRTILAVHHGANIFPVDLRREQSNSDIDDQFLKQFNLTKRELEIIQLIKLSYSNQQMADTLHLSIYTVETHRKNIMQKLGLNSPVALMKFIIENDL